MTRSGKHGKPKNRLPTCPLLLEIPLDSHIPPVWTTGSIFKTTTKAADRLKLSAPQGACYGCLRSRTQRMSRYTHPLAALGVVFRGGALRGGRTTPLRWVTED